MVMASTLVLTTCGVAAAEVNPFEVIVDRNVFRFLPFPAQPRLLQEVPPKVLPKVVVTGITDVCGRRQVLAEVSEVGKPSVRTILTEGESFAGLEVVRIDLDKNHVEMRILGEVKELKLQIERSVVAPPPMPGLAVRR
jgi:predicted RNA-binding protein